MDTSKFYIRATASKYSRTGMSSMLTNFNFASTPGIELRQLYNLWSDWKVVLVIEKFVLKAVFKFLYSFEKLLNSLNVSFYGEELKM